MPNINSLVNVFPICLRKRLEVGILVSPTYHMSAFLVTDVFDKIWDMNILQCRWLEIHCLIFRARNLLLTSLNWEREQFPSLQSLNSGRAGIKLNVKDVVFSRIPRCSICSQRQVKRYFNQIKTPELISLLWEKHHTIPFHLLESLQLASWYPTIIGKPGYQK